VRNADTIEGDAMLFLARSQVNPPASMDAEEWQRLAQAESDYGIQKRREGKLVDIWRIAGEYAAFSLWDASDNDELHETISGLPMFSYATFDITPLATHPSTVRWNAILADKDGREA
jgi:muconolactone D-isomerase